MQKICFLIVLFFYGVNQGMQAQSKTELGFRIGDTQGALVALDLTIPRGEYRTHASLGFSNSGITAAGLYNYLFKMTEKFYFYPGIGAEFGLRKEKLILGVAAELGVEFRVPNSPFSIGADWRPNIALVNPNNFSEGGYGINIRYRFD
jgi:hypothetical protein